MKNIVSKKYQSISGDDIKNMKQEFKERGILVFENFLTDTSLYALQSEANLLYKEAYRSSTSYNPFVESDDNIPSDRLKNIRFTTKKQCICYDQIPRDSFLKQLYNGEQFQNFIKQIVGISQIYPYADTLSGININYYNPGDSLEWHYDNCNFTITLLIQKSESGGIYEYFPNQSSDSQGKEDYKKVEKMIDGTLKPSTIDLKESTLVLFRGTESLHRVTEIGEGQRILVTFCYNNRPGISLSETSRKTFFGRLN